jgi:hypothetical protein
VCRDGTGFETRQASVQTQPNNKKQQFIANLVKNMAKRQLSLAK